MTCSPLLNAAPMVFDEAFSFVQEGVTWFGPTFHVVIQVKPALDDVLSFVTTTISVPTEGNWR